MSDQILASANYDVQALYKALSPELWDAWTGDKEGGVQEWLLRFEEIIDNTIELFHAHFLWEETRESARRAANDCLRFNIPIDDIQHEVLRLKEGLEYLKLDLSTE